MRHGGPAFQRDLGPGAWAAVRATIDAVRSTRARYALGTMPWAYPDSAESHERLIAVIDRPGLGGLDHRAYLSELSRLPADAPLMLEHLPDEEEYLAAATHVRGVARELGIALSPRWSLPL